MNIHSSFADHAAAFSAEREDARVRLKELCAELGAQSWPWHSEAIEHHRTCMVPYLCGLLFDELEAADWACRIEAEMARLDGRKDQECASLSGQRAVAQPIPT